MDVLQGYIALQCTILLVAKQLQTLLQNSCKAIAMPIAEQLQTHCKGQTYYLEINNYRSLKNKNIINGK